jgi:predicted kinase
MPEPLRRGSSAIVIAQAIRNDIQAGRLPHGRQLPSTRELAAEWNTSVATINRAMDLLVEEGLVHSRARASRFVKFPEPAEAARKRPQVLLIGGYAGAGKTELGRVFTRLTGWAILDKDTTTRPVVEAALDRLGTSPHDRESDTYLSIIRPAEYQALLAAVVENVQCGASVVATAPFLRELHDGAWCDLVSTTMGALEADLHTIWVRCDADSMHTYLTHRGASRDAAKLADWENYLQGVDLQYQPLMPHHIIDNSAGARPLREQAAELLSLIGVAA